MLFHITHTHEPDRCPANSPAKSEELWSEVLALIKEHDIILKGAYACTPAHTVYIIIDTDSAEKIELVLKPLLSIGKNSIVPVTSTKESASRLSR